MKKVKSLSLTIKNLKACSDQNGMDRVRFEQSGEELLTKIEHEKMSEELALQIRQYVIACNTQVRMMFERRKPLTDQLIAMRQMFVIMENAINPKEPKSPAYRCEKILANYLQERAKAYERKSKSITKQHFKELDKLVNLEGISDEERNEQLLKLIDRTDAMRRNLNLKAVETEMIPEATSADGYIEIFKFWWERVGRFMPSENLDRIFHPMLMYAKLQARKGTIITAKGVNYRNEPKLKCA